MRLHLVVSCAAVSIALAAVESFATAAPSQAIAGARTAGTADEILSDSAPSFGNGSEGDETVAGEIAVDLRDDASPADIADIGARYGLALRPNSAWSTSHDKLEVADVPPANEAAAIDALLGDPRVEHVEPMALYRASFVPNDPLYVSKQWHLQRVGAEAAWHYSCGRGVTVAVVDTGIACFDKGPFSRGTDLAGTRCEGGWNFVDDSSEAYDDHGHGTHVAGTIAQTTNNGVGTAGLAFCARLMPIKVLSKQGFGTVANVAEGIRYAADEGAQVINLSLGGPIKSGILEDAVKHALAKGVVIVAAAGNSGGSVGWPAAYPGVMAVSATDSNDKIAWFSSRGPEVAIAAPGVGVTQQTVCNGGRDKCEVFGTFNGTSMASPHVAGVAAMVEALGVTDVASVRRALESTARRPEVPGNDDKSLLGAGILDAAAAVSHVYWTHFLLRAIALFGVAWGVARRIRKGGGKVTRTPGAVLGTLVASVGLFPLFPLLGFTPHTGGAITFVELVARPLGEWDLVLVGAGLHRWLFLASALPAVMLTGLGFANRRVRPFIGGIALGTAALLAQMAWTGDAAFGGGAFLMRIWAVANALVCLWLARTALEARGGERARL
jgi:serine protease